MQTQSLAWLPTQVQTSQQFIVAWEVQGIFVDASPSTGFTKDGRPTPGTLYFEATVDGNLSNGQAFHVGDRVPVRFPLLKGEGEGNNGTVYGSDGVTPYHYWAENTFTLGAEYHISHDTYDVKDDNDNVLYTGHLLNATEVL